MKDEMKKHLTVLQVAMYSEYKKKKYCTVFMLETSLIIQSETDYC